jgi:hypothetical protein
VKTQPDNNPYRPVNHSNPFRGRELSKNAELQNAKNLNQLKTPEKPVGSPDTNVEVSDTAKAKHKAEFKAPEVPNISNIPIPKKNEEEKIKEIKKVEEKEVKKGSVKNPAIFFITGVEMFGLSDSWSSDKNDGVRKMAESLPGARLYNWSQKKEMLNEIEKIHADYPVLIIGHSVGGDTAVEIANELDSVEHNFRKVNLLVTLDAIGLNNDIIPQNVGEHINIFGENSFLLNDGPHAPRRADKSKVTNILSPLDHADLDDAKDIQFDIISAIQSHLKSVEYVKKS